MTRKREITPRQAAKILGIKQSTVRLYCRQGRFEYLRTTMSGRYYLLRKEILRRKAATVAGEK